MEQSHDEPSSSALYWLPRIEAAGLPVPKTVVVPYDHRAAVRFMESVSHEDGDDSMVPCDLPVGEVLAAVRSLKTSGFVRTDLGSAKHDGPLAYRIEPDAEVDDVARLLWHLVEDQELKFWMSGGVPGAFLVREFLELEARFAAFGHYLGERDAPGHPIAREWRYFAVAGEGVHCSHPYWPADAIKFKVVPTGRVHPDGFPEARRVEPPGWREALAELHEPVDQDLLEEMALRAVEVCQGATWSVDFARDVSGKWWLIDMALAGASWHPECSACSVGELETSPA